MKSNFPVLVLLTLITLGTLRADDSSVIWPLPKDIMPDGLHPNAAGYEIWANAITPVVEKYFRGRRSRPLRLRRLCRRRPRSSARRPLR